MLDEDLVLGQFLANWAAAKESQGLALNGRSLRGADFVAVDTGRPASFTNIATLMAPLTTSRVSEVAVALDDFYQFGASGRSGAVFLFSPWPTPDLRIHGWTLLEHAPLMHRPPGGELPPSPSGLRIQEIRDEEGLCAFDATIRRGFSSDEGDDPNAGREFGAGMLADDRHRLWVGWERNSPVSAAATFVAVGVNDLKLVATVPEARRRGYGAALTWRATFADPGLPSLLIATEEGRSVYERVGYSPLARFALWFKDRPNRARDAAKA